MSNVSEWSTTAGSNNSSPPNGWPEGMQRSAVNDAAREMMAALAKWYQDAIGTLTTAGGTTAYTLVSNNVYTNLNDIPMIAVKVNATNTGAVTLNVDGLGAKSVVKAGGAALVAGDFATGLVYQLMYNLASTRFEIMNQMPQDGFASGTALVFNQTAAPTGWTKGATHNDKALRVVTGTASSGGSTAFTSVFASRTIAQANLPNVNLSAASLSGSVGTSITNGTNIVQSTVIATNINTNTGGSRAALQGSDAVNVTLTLASGTVTFGGNVPLGGSGTALDFAVQYVDVILATKN